MTRFSVAPTLGKSSQIVAPVSRLALATMKPCSFSTVAPILSETGDVEVERARADGVATGQGDVGFAGPGQQRPEHRDGRPHPPHEVVVGAVVDLLRDVDRDRGGAAVTLHVATEPAQQLGHDRDVEDVGHLAQRGDAGGQQSCRHELEHRVLGAGDPHLTGEPGAAGHPEPLRRARAALAVSTRPS